jgi:hypothetical protein
MPGALLGNYPTGAMRRSEEEMIDYRMLYEEARREAADMRLRRDRLADDLELEKILSLRMLESRSTAWRDLNSQADALARMRAIIDDQAAQLSEMTRERNLLAAAVVSAGLKAVGAE